MELRYHGKFKSDGTLAYLIRSVELAQSEYATSLASLVRTEKFLFALNWLPNALSSYVVITA